MSEAKSALLTSAAVVEPDNQVDLPSASATSKAPESDVQSFIRGNRLEKWLDVTYRLIARHFSPECGIVLQKKEDAELSDEWVSVRVVVGGDVASILDAYDAFTLEMVSAMPAEVGRKIRLSIGMG